MTRTMSVTAALLALAAALSLPRPAAGELRAFHRSGQTFVTWTENDGLKGEQYRVRINSKPITAENVGHAKRAATLYEGSGQFRFMARKETRLYSEFPKRWPWLAGLWIEDVDKGGKPLPPGTGLFVRTAKEAGTIHLAVQTVHEGKVVDTEVFPKAIQEKVAPPRAVKMPAAKRKPVSGVFAPVGVGVLAVEDQPGGQHVGDPATPRGPHSRPEALR